VVESGVRTAYEVIDEYMRRGQEAARGIFNDLNMGGYMSNNRQNCPGGPGYGGPGYGFTPWNPMAMVTEQWIAAMCAWSQAWCSMVPGLRQPATNPCYSTEERTESVKLKTSSKKPAEFSASLCPGLDLNCIESEPLEAQGFEADPIPRPVLSREEGKVVMRITVVDPEQKKGTYRGLILRRSDRSIVGDVTVKVME
jgi:hypothetical protein